jgi:hypothetical protein
VSTAFAVDREQFASNRTLPAESPFELGVLRAFPAPIVKEITLEKRQPPELV